MNKQDISLKFGKFILKSDTPPEIIKRLSQIRQEIINKYRQFKYFIFIQLLSSQDWKQLLYWTQKFEDSTLHFTDIKLRNQQSIDQVLNINFVNLSIITLSNCQITSLEWISWFDCPLLRSLVLQSNNIVFLKSLAKSNFNKIQVLDFIDNHFSDNELSYLNRMKNNKKISQLSLQTQYCMKSRLKIKRAIISNINQLFKLQIQSISQYCFIDLNLSQMKISSIFRQKFNKQIQGYIQFFKIPKKQLAITFGLNF